MTWPDIYRRLDGSDLSLDVWFHPSIRRRIVHGLEGCGVPHVD